MLNITRNDQSLINWAWSWPSNPFLPRDAMLAQYILSLCLSVRPSQAGTVPKRLNVESRKQRHTIARDFCSLLLKMSAKFRRRHPLQGRQTDVG